MTKMDLEQFEIFDRTFSVCLRGLEDHLDNDLPNPRMIVDTLWFMENRLHDLIVSCKGDDSTENDFADKYYGDICKAYERGLKDSKGSKNEDVNKALGKFCDEFCKYPETWDHSAHTKGQCAQCEDCPANVIFERM